MKKIIMAKAKIVRWTAACLLCLLPVCVWGQEASPVVRFYSVDEEAEVEVTPGESQTAQAPLEIAMTANVSNLENYKYVCEWRLWRTNEGETTPMMTRFEEETTYTLTKSGGYGIKLYVTFTQEGDTIEYESEQMTVVISESKLNCPDGFSPNGDGINDYFRITAQSIVKLEAAFFNRWGQKVHSVNLDTAEHAEGETNKLVLWDGRVNGKYVKDGVYFLNLYGLGSDGIEYKIKKAVNVLKGFNENSNTAGGGE
ncbi:MAG: gliding motility-associated C-terminal domain-containing protein [Prevotellaceae bacterium]|nr:gliding motility-associated C-terminal domain-containing protein [Prevotellaceae bacterium]